MAKLNFAEAAKEQEKCIKSREQTLCKGLTQPFNSTISGSRKILSATQRDHVLCLYSPEFPLVSTGYETRFGENSSSFTKAKGDFIVLGRVEKFSANPGQQYSVIVQNKATKEIDVIERKSYSYITESYGYINDTKYIDKLTENSEIKNGDVVYKSLSFDDFNNYRNGVNLRTAYISCDSTMEDAILIAKSASEKLKAPLIKKVLVYINDNDILLNLYGDSNFYKTFPALNEHIKDNILCGIRREQREESLFMQSMDRLQDIMMSDTKYTLDGKIIDINVYCNNPEALLSSKYNSEVNYYYQDHIRFCREIVAMVAPYAEQKIKMSYKLQQLYFKAERILNGTQYIRDRAFSNIIIEFFVEEESNLEQGDKLSDRYGGKGVIGSVVPDELMPRLENGEYVEIIFNSSTCVNRLNPGQLFETSLTHIGSRIIEYMCDNLLDYDECISIYIKYLNLISPVQAAYMSNYLYTLDESQIAMFVNALVDDDGLLISVKPISESISIDDLDKIYKEFPWIQQHELSVPIQDSNGNYRYVKSRRAIVCGKKYIYRLKQYAEDKFSVTSLSATNIRNENSRSRANKEFKGVFTKTPIRFGEMETGDLGHLGMEHVIINLMIHSASPHARRLASQLLNGDAFNIDIKLDSDSSNRNVEILNAYLKTMGLRLIFKKTFKKLQSLAYKYPVTKVHNPMLAPVTKISENEQKESLYVPDKKYNSIAYKIPVTKIGKKKKKDEDIKDDR